MRLNLPTLLTVIRLIAAPCVLLVFVAFPRPVSDWLALVLFVGTAATDWVDGYLARRWGQVSRVGAMLDPIADKALVVIALVAICGYNAMSPWLVIPTAFILFREVFVSGLREYLGDVAGTLKVTQLAKWKTMVQMVAISLVFLAGIFEHRFGMAVYGMDAALVSDTLQGRIEDVQGLRGARAAMVWTFWGGVALLWTAAALTVITGIDYFRKALPHVTKEEA